MPNEKELNELLDKIEAIQNIYQSLKEITKAPVLMCEFRDIPLSILETVCEINSIDMIHVPADNYYSAAIFQEAMAISLYANRIILLC